MLLDKYISMFRESYLKCRYIGHFWYTLGILLQQIISMNSTQIVKEYENFDRPFHKKQI